MDSDTPVTAARGKRMTFTATSSTRRPGTGWRLVAALAFAVLAVTACTSEPDPRAERDLTIDGPEDGAVLNAEGLEQLAVEVRASWTEPGPDPELEHPLGDLRVVVDGEDRTDEAELGDDTLIWRGADLDDGERTIQLFSVPVRTDVEGVDGEESAAAEDAPAPADDPDAEELARWTLALDTVPPEVELDDAAGPAITGQALTVSGTTEAGAVVTIGDDEVTAGDDGRFELELDPAPEGRIDVVATDAAGNTSGADLTLVTVPSRAEVDEIRSVHVSFCGWAAPSLREPVMQLVEDGLINAIQLDLKDETGKVGYDTEVAFAEQIGATTPDCRINLEAAIEELHAMNVPVIGRIVAFADPVLATWAWENDRRELAMQTEDGDLYVGRYAGFGSYASQEVIDYNLDIAEEAAAMGVDHILWDYIRKPDGTGSRAPGFDGDPRDAIVDFTRAASERLAPYGTVHGASVYGISADRPNDVAQDIPRMAEYLDYVAPMTYPSHWGPGEYGVANPLMSPYEIMDASMSVWNETVEGKRAEVIPWLEDSNYPTSLGYPDRESYLRRQIDATYDNGIRQWILWDPAVRYTTSGMYLPPDE